MIDIMFNKNELLFSYFYCTFTMLIWLGSVYDYLHHLSYTESENIHLTKGQTVDVEK